MADIKFDSGHGTLTSSTSSASKSTASTPSDGQDEQWPPPPAPLVGITKAYTTSTKIVANKNIKPHAQPPPPAGEVAAKPSQGFFNSKSNQDKSTPKAVLRRKTQKEKKLSDFEIKAELRKVVNPANPRIRYKIIKKIGSGASGTVFTATDQETKDKVAIKTMNLAQQPKSELIIREISVMKENQHPNLVNFLDSYLVDNELWVIMEYLEGGPLTDILTEMIMRESQIAAILKEIIQAIAFLHSKVGRFPSALEC